MDEYTKRLECRMKELGITRKDLVDHFKKTRAAVDNWFNRTRVPTNLRETVDRWLSSKANMAAPSLLGTADKTSNLQITSSAIAQYKSRWPSLASNMSGSYLVYTAPHSITRLCQVSLLVIENRTTECGVPAWIYAPQPPIRQAMPGVKEKSRTPEIVAWSGAVIQLSSFAYLVLENNVGRPNLLVMITLAPEDRTTSVMQGFFANTVSATVTRPEGGEFGFIRLSDQSESWKDLAEKRMIGHFTPKEIGSIIPGYLGFMRQNRRGKQ